MVHLFGFSLSLSLFFHPFKTIHVAATEMECLSYVAPEICPAVWIWTEETSAAHTAPGLFD